MEKVYLVKNVGDGIEIWGIENVEDGWDKYDVDKMMEDLESYKMGVESKLWDIVCDKRGVESVEDLDDRLLLDECEGDFIGEGYNWELYSWWRKLEEVFMWLYDLDMNKENVEIELWSEVMDKKNINEWKDVEDLELEDCEDVFKDGDKWEVYKRWMEVREILRRVRNS